MVHLELGHYAGCRGGPDEGLGVIVGARDIAVDDCHEVIDGAEHPTPQRLTGEPGEEAFDGVEPGARRRGEMECPSRIVGQLGEHLGVFVSGIVIHDGMDDFAGRHRVLDLIEEGDELLVTMARRTAPENRALQRVQRSE